MRINYFLFLVILIVLQGCSERISLENELACPKFKLLSNTIEKTDFHKNFNIKIPKNWKYKLYYDDFQSSLSTADTIKELTNTFILDVAYKNGLLELNNTFKETLEDINPHPIIKSNFEEFKDLNSYWQVTKGNNSGYTYHEFTMYIVVSELNYLQITSKIYGSEFVDERLCDTFTSINSIEILK